MAKNSVIETSQAEDGEFVPLSSMDDTRGVWDDWSEALKQADSTGEVRCYRLPIDPETGKPSNKQGQQEYLTMVQFDAFSFDSLVSYLREAFMRPDEQVMAVRIAGYQKGERGNKFSRVVFIRQDRIAARKASEAPSSGINHEALMRTMQDTVARQVELLKPAIAPQGPSVLDSFVKVMAVASPLLAPIVAAFAERMLKPAPPPPMGPSLNEQLETLVKLQSLTGGGGGDDTSMLGFLKSVAPSALGALSQISAQRQQLQQLTAPPASMPQRRIAPVSAPSTPVAPVISPEVVTDTPATPQPPPLENAAMNPLAMKQLVDVMIQQADANADPREVAIALLDHTLSDSDGADLANKLADEKSLDRLSMFVPAINSTPARRAWFDQLRLAILAEFNDEGSQS